MSKITKANEIKIPETVVGLIYGIPGCGKTSLALSAPKPVLLLDTDGGVSRVEFEFVTDTVQVRSYQDILDALNEDLTEYKTIVIDTLGELISFMLKHFAELNPSMIQKGGNYDRRIYGLIKNEFIRLRDSFKYFGKNLIYVCHAKESEDNGSKVYRLDVIGSSGEEVVKTLDFMGFMEITGKRRTIDFSPCSRYYTKNSIRLEDFIQIPILELGVGFDNNFLEEGVIKPSIERRNKIKQEKIKIDKQISDGRKLIGKDPNATLEAFKGMELSPYAKGILFKELCNSTELVFKDGRIE